MKTGFKISLAAVVLTSAVLFGCGGRGGSFTDERDGKTYRYVTVGTIFKQTWMAENLNFAAPSGSWCYDNDESDCNTYGRLYDWETALTVCPQGWRLPTIDDWIALEDAVGGSATTAGGKLKSKSGWRNNGNGTDNFDFTALPGGGRFDDKFENLGLGGYWWSASESSVAEEDTTDARGRARALFYDSEEVLSFILNKASGLSVRCVRE